MTAPHDDPEPRGLTLNGVPVDGRTGARTVAPLARSLLVTGSALVGVPVILGVVVVVIGGGVTAFSPVPFVAGLVVGLLAAAVVPVVGYRLPVLTPADAQPGRVALQRFQTAMFLRMAICEVPAIVALALTITATPTSWLNYLPGGLVSLVLLTLHVRPSRASVARSEQALEAGGVRSGLAASFGW